MNQPNQTLRRQAAGAGIKLWQIADRLGYTDSYFSRILRKELTGDMKEKAYSALNELKKEAATQ